MNCRTRARFGPRLWNQAPGTQARTRMERQVPSLSAGRMRPSQNFCDYRSRRWEKYFSVLGKCIGKSADKWPATLIPSVGSTQGPGAQADPGLRESKAQTIGEASLWKKCLDNIRSRASEQQSPDAWAPVFPTCAQCLKDAASPPLWLWPLGNLTGAARSSDIFKITRYLDFYGKFPPLLNVDKNSNEKKKHFVRPSLCSSFQHLWPMKLFRDWGHRKIVVHSTQRPLSSIPWRGLTRWKHWPAWEMPWA